MNQYIDVYKVIILCPKYYKNIRLKQVKGMIRNKNTGLLISLTHPYNKSIWVISTK
jgi:hypothetical protein